MNQKGFWSSKFAVLFSSLVLGFKAAYLRESICACTLPGALSTVSIFVSSELPSCFSSFFCSPVLLFELQAQRLSGQLLSHPKDKLALKFLPPVLNVAKVFFFFFSFDLLCLSFFVLNNVFLVWYNGLGKMFAWVYTCLYVCPSPSATRCFKSNFNGFQSVCRYSSICLAAQSELLVTLFCSSLFPCNDDDKKWALIHLSTSHFILVNCWGSISSTFTFQTSS